MATGNGSRSFKIFCPDLLSGTFGQMSTNKAVESTMGNVVQKYLKADPGRRMAEPEG